MKTWCQFILDQQSESKLAAAIGGSAAGSLGDNEQNQYTLIVHDIKVAGETTSRPHLRIPALQKHGAILKRHVGAVCRRVGTEKQVFNCDLHLLTDGSKHGLQAQLLNTFDLEGKKPLPKQSKCLLISIDEDSIKPRLQKVRGGNAIHLWEMVHLVPLQPIDLGTSKPRLHFAGSTQGDMIGPTKFPEYDSHSSHPLFQDEFLHSLNANGVIDFGPDGTFALACLLYTSPSPRDS